jgi:hypothetical protein
MFSMVLVMLFSVAISGGWLGSGLRVVIAGDIFDVAFDFLAEVVDFFAGDFGFAFALVAFFGGAFFAVGFFAVGFFAVGFAFAMIFLLLSLLRHIYF